MLQHTPKLNTDIIHEIIRCKERQLGFKLSMEDFDFLTGALINFIDTATSKFIDGAKRHFDETMPNFTDGGFSFITEAHKEAIDLWMYLQAEQHKQRKEQRVCSNKNNHNHSQPQQLAVTGS